ncbi:MAG TPA: GNAT family N-acetyltransferase [Fimbriimonadaceae bacterium]|nr:GNAT family N-acetyltransferase [Fimbriimonadaceae bacterium]
MIETRPATPEDEAFLRRLFQSVRSAEYAPLSLPEAQFAALIDMQFRAQRMQYRATFPEAAYSILREDGAPIGNLTVDRSGDSIHIVDVNLLPERRGQGIGTEVLTGLQKEAASEGKPLSLQVAATNPAQNLYRRLGFQQTSDDGIYIRMEWMSPE